MTFTKQENGSYLVSNGGVLSGYLWNNGSFWLYKQDSGTYLSAKQLTDIAKKLKELNRK